MSDPGFREIHLSGKHVVFSFMAISVVAVGVFLLGVSVGKGIAKPETAAAQATPSANGTDAGPDATPESTKPNKGELDYYRTLQEKGTPTPAASPAATPSATPSATPAPPAQPASTKPSPTPTPSASPSPAAKPPAATGKPYFVLVDSFGQLKNANTRLAEVKKKGFEGATIYTAPTGAAPYKVRLGPFPDKAAVDAMVARLRKEGYRPSVIR